jgi:hypothetical protein
VVEIQQGHDVGTGIMDNVPWGPYATHAESFDHWKGLSNQRIYV